MNKVVAVVVTYNRLKLLQRVVESLRIRVLDSFVLSIV